MEAKKLIESMREVQNMRANHKDIISQYALNQFTPMEMLLHMLVIEERILKAITKLTGEHNDPNL